MEQTPCKTRRRRQDRGPDAHRIGDRRLVVTIVVGLAAATAGHWQAAATDSLADPGVESIHDGNLPLDQRVRTVEQMLRTGSRDAIRRLQQQLVATVDPDTQQVIVRALRRSSIDILKKFDKTLIDLLETGDETILPDIATALGRLGYEEKLLRRIAADTKRSDRARRGAILALAHHHSRDAARTLVRLIGPEQSATVRLAAFEGMRHLTGNFDLPDDPHLWRTWWNENGSLGSRAWRIMVLRNYSNHAEHLIDLQQQLENRLVQSLRREYLGHPQTQRTALLVKWLDDPVPATQRLAMNLIEQRLIDVQAPAISQDLRAALRLHLADPAAVTRRRSAEALSDLRDERAAQIVARRLSSGAERHVQVLRAYLKLLRSVPRREAVVPALQLLGDPRLTNEAADVLAEAAGLKADNGQPWLDEAQVAKAIQQVRHHLRSASKPHPSMIRLLGRLAPRESARDWRLIAGYLDSGSDTVKDAAARTWAESSQPLDPLNDRIHDPVIQPFLFDAIAQRGSQPGTLLRLISHRPDTTSLGQAWERATLVMAGRVGAETVLRADRRLARDEQNTLLREKFLDMAIGRLVPSAGDPNGTSTDASGAEPAPLRPMLVNVLLRRAELHLDKGKPQLALAIYQRLAEAQLDAAQSGLFEVGRLRSHLALGDVTQAVNTAHTMLQTISDPAAAAPIANLLLDTAERSLDIDQHDVARRIATLLQDEVIRDLPTATRQRLDRLQTHLRMGEASSGASDAVPSDAFDPSEADYTAPPTEPNQS